ncbi:MAG: TadE/TadG family type IV pilus assembly protein [Planctomycetota bacterium]
MVLLAQLDTTTPADWWWTTLTSGPALWLLGFAVLCLGILLYLCVRLRAVSAQVRKVPVKQRLSDDSGVAMIEFVLVTPILLIVTLLLIQTMLVFTGLFYVQYASFAAARTAIVQIPTAASEPANELLPSEGSGKFDAIRSAAMLAVLPVSGRESGSTVASGEIVSGVGEVYSAQGRSEPNWVNEMLGERLNYAVNHTEIQLQRVLTGEGSGTVNFEPVENYTVFSPKEAIAVVVRHEFALTVPLASRVFAAAGESGSYSPAGRDSESPGPPGQWTMIESRSILTNEGIDRRLPEAPPVPRR